MRVVPPGGGEVVGDSPERRVEILSDHDALHATWSRYAPGRDGASLHVHHEHTDLFYVLTGELTLRLGVEDRQVVLPAGTLARMPPLVVHGFRNAGDTEVTYLNLHTPGRGFAQFLRDGDMGPYDQWDPPEDGGRSSDDAVITADGPVLADEPGIAVDVLDVDGTPAPDEHLTSYWVLDGPDPGAWLQVEPGEEHALSGPARALRVRVPVS